MVLAEVVLVVGEIRLMVDTSDTPIVLDNNVAAPEEPISLDTGTVNYLLSPETVTSRAAKAAYGLKGTSAETTVAALHQNISTGQEDPVRQDSSVKINTDSSNAKNEAVTKAIAAKGSPLTEEELKWINGVPKFNTFTNPNSVFEVSYANNYVNELDAFAQRVGDTNPWLASKMIAANDVEATKQYGSVTMAQHEYLLTKAQNLQSMIDNQSYLGTAADFLKMAFPIFNPYHEIKMRGNVLGSDFTEGGLLGGNLEAQRNRLMNLPFDKFTETVDKIYNNLSKDNPQAALAFMVAMMGQSSSDKILNNINTVGNLLDLPAFVGIGKLVFNKASMSYQIKQATKTILKSNAVNPDATEAGVLASVGDIPSASINQAHKLINNRLPGAITPTKEAIETLPSIMRIDQANIAANPGNMTTTMTNAIIEQYNSTKRNVVNALSSVLRPTRLPMENASPEVIAAFQKATYSRYPGPSNAIIDMADPILEPISNTYFIKSRIGKNAGEFFTSEEEALNYARAHGIVIKRSPEQMANLEARIADLEQSVKIGPSMEDDAAGLNHYYGLEKQLKDLKEQHAEAKSVRSGAAIGTQALPRIDQQGLGHYIELTKPLKETDRVVRDFIYDTSRKTSVSPDSWTKYVPFFNYARTAEDTMSSEALAARKSAVYPQAVLLALAREEGKYISDLHRGIIRHDPVTGELNPWYKRGVPFVRGFMRKDEWKAFQETLKYSQDMPDPKTGIPGHYFESPGDLTHFYLGKFGRAPSFSETQAYFATKRWDELDHVLRTVGLYRNKTRLGAETHTVSFVDAAGQKNYSPKFDGTSRNTFPGGDGNVLIINDDGSTSVRSLQRMTLKEKKAYDEDVSQGKYKVVELYSAEDRPFNGWVKDGDKRVDFVLSKTIETSPLTWDQLPFRGGGHQVYDYEKYVKQAIIRTEKVDGNLTHRYEGDRTVVPVTFGAMGEDFADKMNQVRVLLRANKIDEAKAFTAKHLPYEWKDLKAKFTKTVDGNGVSHPPVFNLNEPFQVVPRNKSIIDMNKDLELRYSINTRGNGVFKDDTRNGMARNFQIEFTGQRDAEGLKTIDNVGTLSNPVYNFRPAEKVDPIKVMNRGLSSIIHSTFMDDYKTFAVETWLREAAPYLKAHDSEIRSSPFFHFKTASRDVFKAGVPEEIVGKLLANRFKIEQLVGAPSILDSYLYSVAQNLADATYSKFGPGWAKLVPTSYLPMLRDPASFFRSVTFDAYMGLFSIPQMFVQAMSYVNMFAISPRYATQGTMAAVLHGLSRINSNPEILKALDKMASKMGWKAGEWIEAMQTMQRSGFGLVGNEYAPLSTIQYANPILSGKDRFLSWGRKPFQMGEAATRYGAWYMAFKEFRDANPIGAISRENLGNITSRADLLYGNMSSASNSVLHTGFASLPTQFFAYSIRQAELFTGKRLGETLLERNLARARIIAANATMFGVPMAAGVTGLPVGDYLRQELMDNGLFGMTKPYNVNQPKEGTKDFIEAFLMEGLPATILNLTTGNNYNVGPRYGAGGFTQLREVLTGDANFWKTVGGASGTLFYNTFANNFSGAIHAVGAMIRGDTNTFPVKAIDAIDIFKEAKTVSSTHALWVALNTGKWVNKNSEYIKDVTPLNAVFMYVTGLSPTEQTDIHNIGVNLKSQQEAQKFGLKKFQEEWNRGVIASANNDPQNADSFFSRAMAYTIFYDLSTERIAQALSKAMNTAGTSLIDRVAWERYIKQAPVDKIEDYRKIYSDIHNNLYKGQ